MCIEKRNDNGLKIGPTVDRIGHDAAVRPLRCDPTASKERHDLLEYPDVGLMLIDLKTRSDQPPGTDRRMRPDTHTEASFTIHESGEVVRSQPTCRPSLMIVRTGKIVTAHD